MAVKGLAVQHLCCSDLSPSDHWRPGEPQAHRRRVQPVSTLSLLLSFAGIPHHHGLSEAKFGLFTFPQRGRSPRVRRNTPRERSHEDHGGRSWRRRSTQRAMWRGAPPRALLPTIERDSGDMSAGPLVAPRVEIRTSPARQWRRRPRVQERRGPEQVY